MRLALLALLLGCAAPKSPAPSPAAPKKLACITARASGTIECDGLRYDVSVPKACETSSCGLVLDIHGLSMSARIEDANTNMRALGDKYGYVVVQPSANPAPPDRSFGLPDPKMPVWLPDVDETRIFAFLEHAIDKLAIDRDRVHMTGFSLGGMMTWRIFCKHAEVFASIAPASGAKGCSFDAHEMPSREAPVLYLHGHGDQLVPYYSATELRDRVVRAWNMHAIERGIGARYASTSGLVFEFIDHHLASKQKVELGGHCFPGSHDPGTAPGQLYSFACEGPSAFVWGDLVMDFFRAHPRRK
ncbi:MAG: alpha/beta hydrolase family esterase [Polyangiales bacterium]